MYWDGRRKLDRNKHMLLEFARRSLVSYRRVPVPARKKPLSNELATRKVVSFLNEPIVPGSKEEAALHRLAEGMQLKDWGPDLAIKAFDDLDILFFRGVLATRTMINYCTQEHAYFNTLCDDFHPSRRDFAEGKDWSIGGHGHCFRRIITAVDKRFFKYFKMYATGPWESFNLDRCAIRDRGNRHRRPP
ncbi:MAG: hypothetical protein Q9210_004658 [Variospora velana]